jgi:hypothetical protein
MLNEKERVVINGKTVTAYAGIPLLVTDECVGILYINYFEDYALTDNEKSWRNCSVCRRRWRFRMRDNTN